MAGGKVCVLFVCTGNICRSPTAHGVFESMVRDAGLSHYIAVDSAGTYDWHGGDPPDPRARAAARRRGYSLDDMRARPVTYSDFHSFDYILAMDRGHFLDLEHMRPQKSRAEVRMFMEFGRGYEEVPDPYGGGARGFEIVLDMVEEACAGLLQFIRGKQ